MLAQTLRVAIFIRFHLPSTKLFSLLLQYNQLPCEELQNDNLRKGCGVLPQAGVRVCWAGGLEENEKHQTEVWLNKETTLQGSTMAEVAR